MKSILKWVMFFVPHYITEDVMFDETGGVAYAAFSAADLQPGEWLPYIGTVRSITFMNRCYFAKLVGELREYGK